MSSDAPTVRGPYAKTARVREQIVDACMEVFAESGFRSTTMKVIAQRAGISEGGLAHHFASKSDLLFAVLRREERKDAEYFQGAAQVSGIPALLAMLRVAREGGRTPGIVELHSVLSAEAISPEHPAHEHYRGRYNEVRHFARRSFELLEADGLIASPLSPTDLASIYVALWDGLQLQWLYEREVVDLDGALHRFLRSVVPTLPADLD